MSELKIEHDRYDGTSTISLITHDNIQFAGSKAYIEAPLGEDEDFCIYFDTDKDNVDEAMLSAARGLMSQIAYIDNQVQESCAEECKRSGLHPRNYEGMLAFVTISHEKARLRYFGTGVNTEWDELAEMRDGQWRYVGTDTPDISGRKL